ncbi:MAG: alpha/beta fold hydrolase [Blastochloris sp.]|nr:alpha/beta fold hydrolase [Blastochloris sp.]
MFKSRTSRFVAVGIMAPALVIIGLLSYRAVLREGLRQETTITTPNGIESLEAVTLGGVEQWILVRGEDRTKPVLLWLHGGPGQPTMMLAHRHDRELVKQFVVVHWDQRGAGKSYNAALTPEQVTPELLIADTHELALQLRERFNAPKIYLIGHSWGSMLGALTVSRYPDLFAAYIGVGQAVSVPEGYTRGVPVAHRPRA